MIVFWLEGAPGTAKAPLLTVLLSRQEIVALLQDQPLRESRLLTAPDGLSVGLIPLLSDKSKDVVNAMVEKYPVDLQPLIHRLIAQHRAESVVS